MIRHRGGFHQGIDAGFQPLPGDDPVRPGGAVQVMSAVLHLGQPEGDARQGGAVRAGLGQGEGGQLAVGEHKFRIFVGVQVDDPLGVINHIARTLQFCHHISAHRELAEVNGSILRGRIFLGAPGTVYRFNPEPGVGDWFGEVGAVHLRQMDARFQVVEENQFLDAVASF